MAIIWIFLGAAAFYFLQSWLYEHFWNRGLEAALLFQRESAVEGEENTLLEQVENRKPLPLPMVKVKFRVSRRLRFFDEGDSAVTDQYYRNDILSLGPWQRVTRKIPFRCAARGYYRINGLDLVAADLFLSREMVEETDAGSILYVYPRPAQSEELSCALRKLSGEISVKRHMLEDPFEYRGIREYAPFDEQRSINWKATARMDEMMVNVRGYTALREVRIFLNPEDSEIWKQENLVELCIRISVRVAQELLDQGIRVAFYCSGRDCLTGEPIRIPAEAGPGQRESINRALARLDLEQPVYPFRETFSGELEEEAGDSAAVFVSVERGSAFQELLRRYGERGGEFSWLCPLLPRMESRVENPQELHFIRLNGEELLNES